LAVRGSQTPGGRRAVAAVFLALALHAAAVEPPPPDALAPPTAGAEPWRFRLGPFFEIGRSDRGVGVFALRPLFSRVEDPAAQERVTDILWPWSSFHRRDRHADWWALPAFGKDEDVDDPLSRRTFWLLPVFADGRTRDGDHFTAVFPLAGRVRDVFWIDEARFALFPLWARTRQGPEEATSWLWPIYLRETGPDRQRFRLFPFYGETTTPTKTNRFAFWPFWTETVYHEPRRHGRAEMLFPVYATIDTDRDRGWMVLPPFFGRTEMDGRTSVRCPWPFYTRSDGPGTRGRAWWPLWTSQQTANGSRGNLLWPLGWQSEILGRDTRETRTSFVPVYHAARFEHRGTNGAWAARMDYVRVWPLYSRYALEEGTRVRVPELTLLRDGRGIERNWAPFWSWYVYNRRGDARDTDIFWGLARWGRQWDHTAYGRIGPLFNWQAPPSGDTAWQVLGGLIGRQNVNGAGRRQWLWFWHTGGDAAGGERTP
jgi:hypothetical protein